MRLTLIALTSALLASTALAGGLGTMTDAERDAFRAEVRQYLLDNPEVLMEAMDVLQARNDKAAAEQDQQVLAQNHDFLFNDPNSWVGGNPDGDITVVEFVDYRCGYCRKANQEVNDLVNGDGNIRYVVKEFPILGEDSVTSSRFAIAVRMLHGDDAYAAIHEDLITLRGSPDVPTLTRLAQKKGYDAQALLDLMGSDKVTSIIAANHAIAQKLNISGTPTFIFGNVLLRGYLPPDQMQRILADARAG